MKAYFKEIWVACVSIVKGMSVTFRHLARPAVTVQYPLEKLTLPDGAHGLLIFEKEICISCGMCVKACPSACITLETKIDETTKKKAVLSYTINNGRCNFCGLCEESCPVKGKAVRHTKEYEVVYYDRESQFKTWK